MVGKGWGAGGGRNSRTSAGAPPKNSMIGAKKSTQIFFVQSFSRTLRVMDVRAENRGFPHQKVRFSAAPVTGRNFLTPGHPGVRVRNVRGKSGPKSLCLCCFFFPDMREKVTGTNDVAYFSRKVIWTRGGRKNLKTCPPAGAGTKI